MRFLKAAGAAVALAVTSLASVAPVAAQTEPAATPAPAATATPASAANHSDFIDTRITFLFSDDNVFAGPADF